MFLIETDTDEAEAEDFSAARLAAETLLADSGATEARIYSPDDSRYPAATVERSIGFGPAFTTRYGDADKGRMGRR